MVKLRSIRLAVTLEDADGHRGGGRAGGLGHPALDKELAVSNHGVRRPIADAQFGMTLLVGRQLGLQGSSGGRLRVRAIHCSKAEDGEAQPAGKAKASAEPDAPGSESGVV